MRKQKTDKLYRSRVVLRIHSVAQVLDTMRYESLAPDTQNDVGALERLFSKREAVDVTFRRYSANPGGPTVARLASFNIELISWEPLS